MGKRRPIIGRACIVLMLGAIINVAVAWGTAKLYSEMQVFTPEVPSAAQYTKERCSNQKAENAENADRYRLGCVHTNAG